jgi:predicted ArsR family transcriptional regulator
MNISAADTFMRIFKLHRKTDPQTSRAAAARVHEFSGSHKKRIVAALDELGDGTVYEIAALTGIDAHAVGKRIKELEEAKVIECPVIDGEELTRKTPSGRNARVWVKA